MTDEEMVACARKALHQMPYFGTDEDRARIVVHAVRPHIEAEHDRALAKRYSAYPKVAADLRQEAERLDRRGRMVEQ